MRYFNCSVCNQNFEWEGTDDPPKCLSYGHEGKVGEKLTELPPARIVFIDKNGLQVFLHKSQTLGRDFFRIFEDYKFVSNEQLKVVKDEKGWYLEGIENTTNPTFLNNEKLDSGKIINLDYKKENELLIGNNETGVVLKLKISFE